ncbi:trafficking regulator of GLUT4 (SLC2A4) 1b [Salminus brasiliensis]|uniref:trafficking regulator of GLUT4 (SLC2A4) 1b n=1 Tax=Salminus brasiliensis TaxID=930266 RepID=UPI003B8355BF
MAINTDATLETGALGESSAPQPGDFGDTQKLLGVSSAGSKEGLGAPDSRRGSVKSLNAEQNGQRSPFKSGSTGNITILVPSPLSLSRASSPGLTARSSEPQSFMWMAVLSCFCPAIPFNIFALYFAHASRSMIQTDDFEGAKRLGRRSLLFSIIAIVLGLGVIIYLVITES